MAKVLGGSALASRFSIRLQRSVLLMSLPSNSSQWDTRHSPDPFLAVPAFSLITMYMHLLAGAPTSSKTFGCVVEDVKTAVEASLVVDLGFVRGHSHALRSGSKKLSASAVSVCACMFCAWIHSLFWALTTWFIIFAMRFTMF